MFSTKRFLYLFGCVLIRIDDKGNRFGSNALTASNQWCYSQDNQNSYRSLVPKRLNSGWTGVSDAQQCAIWSLMTFPIFGGFLYNSASGLCSPLLWFDLPSAQGAQPVHPEEGDVYVSCGFCDGEFDVMELSSGELVCLKHVTSAATIEQASSTCAALGAYLVTVKTFPKLELIRTIAKQTVWVGLKYLRSQGIYIWLGDGQTVTNQQMMDTFFDGGPNDAGGNEDCGEFNPYFNSINDISCDQSYPYICEKALPVLAC
ncbi:C-type lectin [Elysia marginata]|uniref:C-type lectin n=1 Tax=Elysia marginata TaxID=1093978 RepID=A0AAV4GGI6_9GAST|nr:C-type lectin [Elysia marginata]